MSEFNEDDLLINDNELKADEALDAIESVNRNKYFQNQQGSHHGMSDDGMHNMMSMPQRMDSADIGPAMLDYSLVLPNPKKSKKDYPWLEVVGEPCYSERQEASGMDLTNVKKKYRKMLCLYCARYNPSTPWSVLKSRKFEADGFAEHEKSTHHIRSLQLRDFPESGGGLVNVYPNIVPMLTPLHALNFDQAQMQHQAQVQVQDDGDDSDNSSLDDGSSSYTKDVNHQQMLALQLQQQQQQQQMLHQQQQQQVQAAYQQQYQQLQMHGGGGMLQQKQQQVQQPQPQPQQPSQQSQHPIQAHAGNPLLSVHPSKTKQSPEWLRIDSKLSFSDRQLMSGKDLSGMKKKYKKVYCQYCHDFNPSSPWAISKARKYEASVLCEHDRSHNHKKAVALREAAMSGGVYQQMLMKPAAVMVPMEKDPSKSQQPQQQLQSSQQMLQPHLVEGVVPVHVVSSGVMAAMTHQVPPPQQTQQQQQSQGHLQQQQHSLVTHHPQMGTQPGGSGMDPNSHNLMMQFQQQQMQLKIQHQQQQQQQQQQQLAMQAVQAQSYHLLQQHHLQQQHQLQQQYSHEQQMQLQNQLKMQHQMHLLQQQQKMAVAGSQQQQQQLGPSQAVQLQQQQQHQQQHLPVTQVLQMPQPAQQQQQQQMPPSAVPAAAQPSVHSLSEPK